MKKLVVILLLSGTFYSELPLHSFAKQTELKEECVQKIEVEKEKFQEKVMDDVLSTYEIKIEEQEEVVSYDIQDLRKISMLTGKHESSLEAIFRQFENISLGQKQLYFFNGNLNTAYILYKDPQYKNVMIKLTRGEDKWSVDETNVKDGRKIDFTKENCKDEHIINKGFNGLFRGLD